MQRSNEDPRVLYGPLTDEDVRYIRAGYATLEHACRGRRSAFDVRDDIRARRLPAPSYVLDDGTEMVPFDYFDFVDEAPSLERLGRCFFERYRRAAQAACEVASDEVIAVEWEAYLDGAYGVCLRRVSPESIFEKESLVRSIATLDGHPGPQSPTWRTSLRVKVRRLDELVREFAPCDRRRFGGSVSRDRSITAIRDRYPAVFVDE